MTQTRKTSIMKIFCFGLLAMVFLVSCVPGSALPTETPVHDELVLYNWVEYMPESVIEAFQKEYGITVKYVAYETQEEVVENLQKGNAYDLVVLGPEFIPQLIEENLLRPIDYSNVPNFKYISPNFRELVFDPGNKYSIPFHWGTTGILVRTDLVKQPVTSWNDLWDPAFAGKVGIWPIARAVIPITLRALGYPGNSEDPAELEAARQYLMQLKSNAVIISNMNSSVVPMLESGEVEIAYGWAYDAILAQDAGVPIEYIIPSEGSILWTDHFITPANGANPQGAELFLNFILRPEISGQIVNDSYYPMAHDGAEAYILPEILHNPAIFPSQEQMQKAEITLPLHKDRKWIYDEIWESFIGDNP